MVAILIGGPLDGERVQVAASTRSIDVHRSDGTFASYSPSVAGNWRYDGIHARGTSPPRADQAQADNTVAA